MDHRLDHIETLLLIDGRFGDGLRLLNLHVRHLVASRPALEPTQDSGLARYAQRAAGEILMKEQMRLVEER